MMKYFLVGWFLWMTLIVPFQGTPPVLAGTSTGKVVPVVSDADQAKIRKMQLDDARISNAIQTRQLEILELQKRRDANAAEYQKFVSRVCGEGFVFSQENDELRCVENPKEKK